MADPIVLQASTDQDALVNAIADATAQGVPLLLGPGVHLTRPGRANRMEISGLGLTIDSLQPDSPATIMRPRGAIDLADPDDNHGLFFVPERPNDQELATAQWHQGYDMNGDPYMFAVIIRGSISINGVRVDCNMGQQGLETLASGVVVEHSCMLGFAGRAYDIPGDTKRTVFVGFGSVQLTNLVTDNGGYADDIWFSRGGFYPNIVYVRVDNLVSTPRVIDRRRATLDFSGLCHDISITNSQIFELGMEDAAIPYRDLPRAEASFNPSRWWLNNITMDKLDLGARGKVYLLYGSGLRVKESCFIYEAGGVISNSTLRVGQRQDWRLIRENALEFRDVTWTLDPDDSGKLPGLKPTAQHGDPCHVFFINNVFNVSGNVIEGQIFDSEYSRNALNQVQVWAIGCHYPSNFGYDTARPIARLEERGLWWFAPGDLGNRNIDVALPSRDTPEVHRVVSWWPAY
jgi:hypothetical protein